MAFDCIAVTKLLKYLNLVELTIVMVLRSVEDERAFSTMNFMKSKLYNQLTIHLNFVVWMHAQIFYKFETFPFYKSLRMA